MFFTFLDFQKKQFLKWVNEPEASIAKCLQFIIASRHTEMRQISMQIFSIYIVVFFYINYKKIFSGNNF